LGESIVDFLGLYKCVKIGCHQLSHEITFIRLAMAVREFSEVYIHVFGRRDEDVIEVNELSRLISFKALLEEAD